MKHNKKKEKLSDELKERIEGFLFSDSLSATTVKFLLMFIAVGGIAIVGANFPGLIKAINAFKRMGNNHRGLSKYQKKKVSDSFTYLKKKQFIKVLKSSDSKVTVILTNKGKKRLAEYSLDILEIKKPEIWDRKWTVLTFDIPAHPKSYNYAREALRKKIKNLGFYQIQKSVWVYPYECEDEILFIAEMFNVQKYIEILKVERLLHEDVLKKNFSLS